MLPWPAAATVHPAASGGDSVRKKPAAGSVQDLEELERQMLLQEIQEIRQRSRKSMMEPIKEEAELAFRYSY
jgi:hypothetical protein